MAEVGAPESLANGERKALFRLHAAGAHFYATLREPASGQPALVLELRRGLVWGFSEAILRVTGEVSATSGVLDLVVDESGARASSGRSVPRGDLPAFAREALGLAAARLGVELGVFTAATHVDLGEAGTLGLEPGLRERSARLLEQARAGLPAPAPGVAPRPMAPEPAVVTPPAPVPPAASTRPAPVARSTPAARTPAATAPAATAPAATAPAATTPPATAPPATAPPATTPPATAPAATAAPATTPPATAVPAATPPAATTTPASATARSIPTDSGRVAAAPVPEELPAPSLLGRFVRWLRRAAQAAFGR